MMVSLDHTIYFHAPRAVRADQWLCSEMESPWSGAGRGLVVQRMWNREGVLVASCVQEVSLFLYVFAAVLFMWGEVLGDVGEGMLDVLADCDIGTGAVEAGY